MFLDCERADNTTLIRVSPETTALVFIFCVLLFCFLWVFLPRTQTFTRVPPVPRTAPKLLPVRGGGGVGDAALEEQRGGVVVDNLPVEGAVGQEVCGRLLHHLLKVPRLVWGGKRKDGISAEETSGSVQQSLQTPKPSQWFVIFTQILKRFRMFPCIY